MPDWKQLRKFNIRYNFRWLTHCHRKLIFANLKWPTRSWLLVKGIWHVKTVCRRLKEYAYSGSIWIHTAVRIYHRLRYEHGYEGSESTVRRYVRDARIRLGINMPDVFIPLDTQLGLEAEVDWGTCYAILRDEYMKLKLFCMRSKGSGKHSVQCFPCERQQALFEGHILGFSFSGGVLPVLIYDNLTTAVQKILRGKETRKL